MTEPELDRRIRTALLQANWAEYALSPGEEEPELPAGLRRRMRPLLADPFGRRRRARRALGRCAAAAVLALSVSFGALMAVSPDARAWVQRVTVQILEKYTTIRFAGESGASGQPGDWAPTWLPEGYVLESAEVRHLAGFSIMYVYYTIPGEEPFIRFRYCRNHPGSSGVSIHEKDNTPVEVYEWDGTLYYFLSNEGFESVTWMLDDVTECSIGGELPREDLRKIVDSLYDT